MITIVTAIKNGEKDILNLIFSLNNQTSTNFQWLVIDSLSTDNSINLIKENATFNFRIYSQEDFSIYHAMNIAVAKLETEYYCIAGCDDTFSLDFVSKINAILSKKKYDLILGCVFSKNKTIFPFVTKKWLSPVNASHSVGTVIRTDIHKVVGMYSRMYPIVADKKLVMDIERNSTNIYYSESIFGEYSQDGFSSVNSLAYICDLFKLQVSYNNKILLQILLFIFRISKLLLFSKNKV
ncbi:glycosyltransferase [Pedobacter cryotolerans]|uniref:Glycosyltransferase n=1 Tax=Pedobacter cryotolerans TaxID=2571270 RepID=A0A4U1CBP2_9SPHI|nr:glycosyltransferase [Pedobacter cryotolerans]TKC03496.1 glycosyltransferase [Pedobacter cryotolerans]